MILCSLLYWNMWKINKLLNTDVRMKICNPMLLKIYYPHDIRRTLKRLGAGKGVGMPMGGKVGNEGVNDQTRCMLSPIMAILAVSHYYIHKNSPIISIMCIYSSLLPMVLIFVTGNWILGCQQSLRYRTRLSIVHLFATSISLAYHLRRSMKIWWLH